MECATVHPYSLLTPEDSRTAFHRTFSMLKWALVFAIVAIVAGVCGFTGVAAGAASIAKVLFVVFLVLFVGVVLLALLGIGAATHDKPRS